MYREIKTTHRIDASIDKVWELIKSGANWEAWFPILTGSKVDGNTRICNLENGDSLEESFLASNAEKTFIYTIHKQSSFPAENIVGHIRLEKDDKGTIMYWTAEMEVVEDETFEALKENTIGMYETSAVRLAQLAA